MVSLGAANAAGLPICAPDQVSRLYTLYGTSTLAAAQSSPSIVVGGLALDSPRRRLLFAEQLVQSPGPFSYVRSVNLTTGSFGVFAGKSGANSIGYAGSSAEGAVATNTSLGTVAAIAVNETSGDVFIAEPSIRRVRRISGSNGRIYTVAGTGVDGCPTAGQLAVSAPMSNPQGLLVEQSTGRLLISLGAGCNQVVAIAPNGTIELFAGRLNVAGSYDGDGGASTAAGIAEPSGLAASKDPLSGGPAVLLADTSAHVIRGVSVADGTIRSFIGRGSVAGYGGDGGAVALTSSLSRPTDIAVTPDGDVLFADAGNYVLFVGYRLRGVAPRLVLPNHSGQRLHHRHSCQLARRRGMFRPWRAHFLSKRRLRLNRRTANQRGRASVSSTAYRLCGDSHRCCCACCGGHLQQRTVARVFITDGGGGARLRR